MSDDPQSTAEWLTYQQAARRLGLRSANAAAARARRGNWPKRIRNTDNAAEVLVPGELLRPGAMAARDLVHDLRKLGREAQQVPVQQREAPPPTSDAPALADAVRAAVAPLEAALEREQAATDRERLDRRTLQGQADALRVELAQAQIERAQATGEAATERAKREAAETRAADLQRQLEALEARQRRRWWWF